MALAISCDVTYRKCHLHYCYAGYILSVMYSCYYIKLLLSDNNNYMKNSFLTWLKIFIVHAIACHGGHIKKVYSAIRLGLTHVGPGGHRARDAFLNQKDTQCREFKGPAKQATKLVSRKRPLPFSPLDILHQHLLHAGYDHPPMSAKSWASVQLQKEVVWWLSRLSTEPWTKQEMR